jgi:hypothetical protein
MVRSLLAGLAALALWLAATPAEAASPKTVMKFVLKEREVVKAETEYEAVTNAMMMYTQCPKQYPLDDAKKAYMDELFIRRWKEFREAFTTAHYRVTQKLPSDEMYSMVNAYIKDEQTKTAVNTGKAIQANRIGCKQLFLKQLDTYIEQVRKQDTTPAPATQE